ncbi:DDE-type integrase/transposase/recombinase [Campylobacter sp. RM12920]|nr:DDE-type integrase/transposase/recombinase [Campylobacter sp. RM12920]
MLYAETAVASVIFNVSLSALKEATRRNSQKYPFIRITDAKVRSRGGVKLLFEVEVAQINSCIKSGKLDSDVGVYMLKDGEYSQIKFSEIVGKNSTTTSESESISYFNLSQSEQDSINEKLKILKEWDEYKRAGLSSKKFCKDFNISEARFFRWQRAYKEQGAVGLADKRGKHRVGASKLSGWMMELVLNKFRAYGAGAKLNITEVWKALHKEAGVREGYDYYGFLKGEVKPLFDTGAIKRYLDNYFANKPLELTMITKGMDKAKSYHQPAFGSQGEIITRRNQCWQIDSSPLDVMARDGKGGEAIRADILSIVDVYSGRCVASVESSSNALALVRLMWRALSTLGKPEFIKGDNGKDYLSRQFQYLLNGLGIGYDRAIAYSGDEKGFVERHFRTMQHSGIIAPEFSGEDVIKTNLESIAKRLKATGIVDLKANNASEAIAKMGDFGTSRLIAAYPYVKIWDDEANDYTMQPQSARIAGMIAYVDGQSEFGYSDSYSNRVMNGVVGLADDIDFELGETCTADELRAAHISTVIRESGFRAWGGETSDQDTIWQDLARVRIFDRISQACQKGVLFAIDKKADQLYHAKRSVEELLRQLVGAKVLLGYELSWSEKNTDATVTAGKFYLDVRMQNNPIIKQLTLDFIYVDSYSSQLIENLSK